MSKTQIIVEGAIQQCKDEAAIQVSKWVMLVIRCVPWVQKSVINQIDAVFSNQLFFFKCTV